MEVQRSGSGPENELNPMEAYRADTEVPFRSLSATVGGRGKKGRWSEFKSDETIVLGFC